MTVDELEAVVMRVRAAVFKDAPKPPDDGAAHLFSDDLRTLLDAIEAAWRNIAVVRGRIAELERERDALREAARPECDWCNERVSVRVVPTPPWADPIICRECYYNALAIDGEREPAWETMPEWKP